MRASFIALWLVVTACGGDDPADSGAIPEPPGDPGGGESDAATGPGAVDDPIAPLFDPDRLLEVEVEIDPADWDVLRYEGRSVVDVFTGCVDRGYEYTYLPARVTVNGESLESVGVRKKGYLGSLSTRRPSLKINFAKLLPEQRLAGVKRLTLNNDRQDPSHTHQCMSYALFRDAGLVAPRCNLARVRVNGEDLGIYSHVESIKKPFLQQHFDDVSGNLYEGQGADFSPGFVERLELKNDPPTDPSDAVALTDALQAPAAELEQALSPLLDVDAFEGFWAAEVLTSHWDGYTGDRNNYYAYSHPTRGFTFIPWGTDGAYSDHAFLPDTAPASVYAVGEVARRLYAHEPTRERYRERLRELLDSVWDEDALLDEVDRIAALVGDDADAAALDEQRAFVLGRRAALEAELGATAPAWTFPPRTATGCRDVATTVRASFATTWGSLQSPPPDPEATLELTVDGEAPQIAQLLSAAGIDADADSPAPVVRVVGVLAGGGFVVAQVVLGPVPFEPGEIPLHGMETVGFVIRGAQGARARVLGLFGDGSLTLEEAGQSPGAPVVGHFEGRFVPLPGLFQ